jgi:transposase InsO family protein
MIWHTDLRFLHKNKTTRSLIIAWIHDQSGKCLGFRFLPNKGSTETSAALKSILVSYAAPYATWTDNGGEFQGDFEKLLQQLKIRHIATNPYNPEQKGKRERFSPTIEMAPTPEDVPALIEECNQTPHFGLRATTRRRGRSRSLQLKSGMINISIGARQWNQFGPSMV